MMSVDKIRKSLHDRNLRKVAGLAGVSYSSLRNIVAGRGENLPVAVVKKISQYLESDNG